jgi:hypothetical protein
MGIDTSQFDAGLNRSKSRIDDVAKRMSMASEENRRNAAVSSGVSRQVGVEQENAEIMKGLLLEQTTYTTNLNNAVQRNIRLTAEASTSGMEFSAALREQMQSSQQQINEEEKLHRLRVARAADERREAESRAFNERVAQEARNKDIELTKAATAVKESLITAEQRHNAKVALYDTLLSKNKITQVEHAAAVQMSANALRAQQSGFGNLHGVMMQASFAVEDFTQVLMMGGGLNMALMSASNNITMMLHSTGMIKSVWGTLAISSIPLLLSGISKLVESMKEEEETLEDYTSRLSEYFSHVNQELQREIELLKFRRELVNISAEVNEIKTLEEAQRRLNKLKEEQLRIEQELSIRQKKDDDIVRNMLSSEGSLRKERKSESVKHTQDMFTLNPYSFEDDLAASLEYAKNTDYVISRQKILAKQLEGIVSLDEARLRIGEYLSSIANLEGLRAERERMRALQQSDELRDYAKEKQRLDQERIAAEKEIEDIENRRMAELKKMEEERLRARQKEELFLITANEKERERYGLLKEMLEFSDIDPTTFSDRMTKEEFNASQAFLQAQIQATRSQLNELKEKTEDRDTVPKGTLEQDVFKAQSEAFKQMMEAKEPERNPQIDDTNRKLDTLNDLMGRLRAVIEIVG